MQFPGTFSQVAYFVSAIAESSTSSTGRLLKQACAILRLRASRQRLDNEISSTMARGGSVVTSQTSAAMSSGWIMAARASAEGG